MIEWLTTQTVRAKTALWEWQANGASMAASTAPYNPPACTVGVVLSGGEFTPGGTFPVNYDYPSAQSVAYYASREMKVIRLPFLWERLQPFPYAQLDYVELMRIEGVVSAANAHGMTVALDVHNSGRGWGNLIGGSYTTDSMFADLWGKIAGHFRAYASSVMFMLMNEPAYQPASQWLRSANAAIAAIRQAGSGQTVVVPGSYWDKAMTWTVSDNASVMSGVIDPANNYMFEVHCYLDADGSGGSDAVVSADIGPRRLSYVAAWARASGVKVFIGEFGCGSSAASLAALEETLRFIQGNGDVFPYATWWGGGDRWGDYFMSIEPVDYVTDKPQMEVIRRFI